MVLVNDLGTVHLPPPAATGRLGQGPLCGPGQTQREPPDRPCCQDRGSPRGRSEALHTPGLGGGRHDPEKVAHGDSRVGAGGSRVPRAVLG